MYDCDCNCVYRFQLFRLFVCIFVSGGFMLLAVIIYGSEYKDSLYASFGLVIVAAICSFVAGALMFVSP